MLYIIRGIPGSGKTTLAKQLLAGKGIDYYYEADIHNNIHNVPEATVEKMRNRFEY